MCCSLALTSQDPVCTTGPCQVCEADHSSPSRPASRQQGPAGFLWPITAPSPLWPGRMLGLEGDCIGRTLEVEGRWLNRKVCTCFPSVPAVCRDLAGPQVVVVTAAGGLGRAVSSQSAKAQRKAALAAPLPRGSWCLSCSLRAMPFPAVLTAQEQHFCLGKGAAPAHPVKESARSLGRTGGPSA